MLKHASLSRQFVCLMLLCTLVLGLLCSGISRAEDRPSQRITTELSFDILLPRERPNGLAAQRWAEAFSNLDVPLRIRQPQFNDKAGVDQQTFGTIRRVKVTGQLDRSSMIVFPDRKFALDDTAKLEEWIEELRVYGAQGAPEGQPLWGMQKADFDELHAEMRQPVEQDTSNMSMTEAIRALELPNGYPLRFSAETRQMLVERGDLPEHPHDLRGFAKGTALAMLLRGYGLAFSPRRLPDESFVLAIDPYNSEDKFWPIGWDPDSLGLKRLALAEKMFTATMIGIEQEPLTDLLPRIEKETDLKVFIDPQAVDAQGINPEKLVVNYPRKRTSWSLCLRTILAQIKLTQEVRVDENDRPFIWITQFSPRSLSR